MKQELDEDNIEALVAYRIQRAKETLLIKNRIPAQTHQGVKQMFCLHFIITGKIANKYSRFYSQLFNDRMSGDYDDFLSYDKETLSVLRPQAEEFITAIEKEIQLPT